MNVTDFGSKVELSRIANFELNSKENELFEKIGELLKKEDVDTAIVRRLFDQYFDSCDDPHLSCVKLAVMSPDYRQGKARGLTWNVLNSFQSYKEARKLPDCDTEVKDQVFQRFTRQHNSSILKLAVTIFNLRKERERYKRPIVDLSTAGHYKAACDVSVALQLYDQYPISVFCVPLLLLDNSSTLESYLSQSPRAAEDMVRFLDSISVSNVLQVSELIQRYPLVGKPIGATKLSHKPLDKMIKKYADKYNIPSSVYPLSSERWAKVDLFYWIKQMFDYHDSQLQLQNWREIIERKVGDSEVLKEKLIADLYSFDIREANFWARKFGLESHIVDAAGDDEDWEEEELTKEFTALNDSQSSHEENQDQYLKLPFPEEQVILVDTKASFDRFLQILERSENTLVGLDAEFMSAHGSDQKISLLQLSLKDEVHLLDWETLPDVMDDKDYSRLKTLLFMNKDLLLVGFGIIGDIRLLAKSFSHFEGINKSRNVLDLELVKTKLMTLLKVERSPIRGLSGLCASVLGKPLSKAEQIGDWSRRPLRPSQLVYAALDAWVCLAIYQSFTSRASQQGLEKQVQNIVKEELARSELSKSKSKEKKSPGLAREDAKMKLASTVPDLLTPLLATAQDPRSVSFVCDNMLQGLCRKLRMFGVDCLALDNGQDHLACVSIAQEPGQPRYVLSRGVAAAKIAKHLPPGHTLSLQSNELDLQVEEVFRYFNIQVTDSDLFSRCVLCNGGQYYELTQDQIATISDNILHRRNLRNRNYTVDDYDDDDGCDDFLSDLSEEDEPCLGAGYVARSEKTLERWVSVRVSSSLTGEERQGKVNMLTGDTEQSVRLQVENMARPTIDKYTQFWCCGQCGKVYFEGSHWQKATQEAKHLIKESK